MGGKEYEQNKMKSKLKQNAQLCSKRVEIILHLVLMVPVFQKANLLFPCKLHLTSA